MSSLLTAGDLYGQFSEELKKHFSERPWTISVFEGSPDEGLYSWCPDCVVASTHIKHYEELERQVKLVKFKVGTRKEWEDKVHLNQFKSNFPYLSDVPTAILFMKTLDVYRITAPRESDFEAMCKRAEVYEAQIKSGDWHPPDLEKRE